MTLHVSSLKENNFFVYLSGLNLYHFHENILLQITTTESQCPIGKRPGDWSNGDGECCCDPTDPNGKPPLLEKPVLINLPGEEPVLINLSGEEPVLLGGEEPLLMGEEPVLMNGNSSGYGETPVLMTKEEPVLIEVEEPKHCICRNTTTVSSTTGKNF